MCLPWFNRLQLRKGTFFDFPRGAAGRTGTVAADLTAAKLNHMSTPNPVKQLGLSIAAPRARRGFTLAEVLISLGILGLSLGGILTVYIQSAVRSDWSAHSVSAQMTALSGLEQCRAAKYDPRGSPPTDQLVSSNFPSKTYVLDLGTSVGTRTYSTNTTTILTISTNPPLKLVRVECTWFYPRKGLFTNSAFTYRSANQ